ncbi:ABC transporter permease [Candidatus Thorarchaeota archaeon]|nr:MAG: ABC transporter permease [Candidatus Thorarchaeota archaeon]
MKSRDTLGYSFSAIRLRKLRSGLTTLGIVIGIAAIVALLSFTQGFQVTMTTQFQEGFATDTLVVSAGGMFDRFSGEEPSDFALYVNDTAAVMEIDGVDLATPIISGMGSLDSEDSHLDLSVSGVNYTEYSTLYGTTFVAEQGEIPAVPANDSVVIGSSVYDPWGNGTIFADIGDELVLTITIRDNGATHENNITVTVVGILGEIGGTSFGGGPSDSGVYITLGTAVDLFESEEVSSVVVQLVSDDEATIDQVTLDIEALFDNEASVLSSTSVLEMMDTMLGTIELLLAGIAGISLLVAGIGIMNIMIVSLMERTREIGILKALGAKGRTVLGIFLSEALLIGLIGGVIGIVAGSLLANVFSGIFGGFAGGMGGVGAGAGSQLTSMFTTITPVLTPELMFWAIFYGVVVSVVFGLYPAYRASKLDPVDALRKE